MPTQSSKEQDEEIIICGDHKYSPEAILVRCFKCHKELYAGGFAQKRIENGATQAACRACAPIGGYDVMIHPEQLDEIKERLNISDISEKELQVLGSLIVYGHVEEDGLPRRSKNLEEVAEFIKAKKDVLKTSLYVGWEIRTVFLTLPVKENGVVAFYRVEATKNGAGYSKLAETREEAFEAHAEALEILSLKEKVGSLQ